jgi:hypothetical protein
LRWIRAHGRQSWEHDWGGSISSKELASINGLCGGFAGQFRPTSPLQ